MAEVTQDAELVESFTAALERVGGQVHRVADVVAARAVVRDLCAGEAVVADVDDVLAPVLDGFDLVHDPWEAGVGVTTALAAVAETGTLALCFDRDHPRSTSLVPPVHVAVVPLERMVGTYQEAIDLLAGVRPFPSGMQMITGPSSSGDIEMTLVRGMHGPLAVHAVLVG